MALAGVLALAGCHPAARPLNDREQIVRAVLALTASQGRPVCLDDHTQEGALAVFRQMTVAPRPARETLHWYPPTPLRPDVQVATRQIRHAELDDERLEIREPGARRDGLPPLVQFELDGFARRLTRATGEADESVAIRSSWLPAGVTARWWPLNRMRKDCWPLFVVSNPVRDRQHAFVTLRAEHWGTLYALQKQAGDWRIVAEWSRWLY